MRYQTSDIRTYISPAKPVYTVTVSSLKLQAESNCTEAKRSLSPLKFHSAKVEFCGGRCRICIDCCEKTDILEENLIVMMHHHQKMILFIFKFKHRHYKNLSFTSIFTDEHRVR